ncbi:MAG TPA: Wzt carbohydrate-binding domain-containing protein, partial [Vicinamibacterales bacterium]
KTIVLVTHSLGLVARFCDEALWLDSGRVSATGDPKRVIDTYVIDVARAEEADLVTENDRARERAEEEGSTRGGTAAEGRLSTGSARPDERGNPVVEGRWGSREVEITGVTLLDRNGQPAHLFETGDPVEVRLTLHARQPVDDFVFGIGIFNTEGVCCYGTNTYLEELESDSTLSGDAEVSYVIDGLDLVEGTYKLDVAVHQRDGYPYDYHRLLYTFRVRSRHKDVGIYRPRHQWRFSPSIRFKPAGVARVVS